MPRPKGIVCNLCNGEFFKNSYPIHRKKCEKKYVKVNTACDYCGRMVPNCDMNAHITPCKKRNEGKTLAFRQAQAEKRQQKAAAKAAKLAAEAGLADDDDPDDEIAAMERKLRAMKAAKAAKAAGAVTKKLAPTGPIIPANPNDPANQMQDGRCGKAIDLESEIEKAALAASAEDDGRIACSCCGRGFNPDRIVAHEDICLRLKEKRAQRKNKLKVKTGEDLRMKNTEFAKYKNKRAPDPVLKSRWREDAKALMNVVMAGRNVVRFQRAGVPLSELPASGEEVSQGYDIGDPVMTNDGRRGTVKWVGELPDLPGDESGQIRTFMGIEFNNPVGQHDGTLKQTGERIFEGKSGHCSFVLAPKLLRVKSSHGSDLKTNYKPKKSGYTAKRPPAKETHKEKKLSAKFEDMPKAKYGVTKKQQAPKPPPEPRKVTAESRPQVQTAAARAAAARFENKPTAGSGAEAVKAIRSTSASEPRRVESNAPPRQAGGMVHRKLPNRSKVANKLREKVLRAEGKENGVKHIEAWGGGTNVAERKKPYGDQTLSNASIKYRESKMKGRPDDMAAAAAYKARMRLKKAGANANMPLGVKKATNAAAARAKAKPAFGSAAKSVADDLNEHVFGKEKGQKEYLSNGKFRYKTEARERKVISKKRDPAMAPGKKLGSSPLSSKVSPRPNGVDMGRGGKSLGGAGRGRGNVSVNPEDVRAKRLAFLDKLAAKSD